MDTWDLVFGTEKKKKKKGTRFSVKRSYSLAQNQDYVCEVVI